MIDINEQIAKLDWSREPRGLYEPIGYTLSAGGKRVRPQLVLTACRMFGGEETEALPAALALEVFHNFTLLHDDVMDHAPVRRGRETVHIRWNENTAILSGDQMLIEAYKLVAKVPSDKLQSTLRWFNEMATEICEGQQLDVDFEEREDVQLEEYIEMIRLKTSVLLANALRTGAYLAGATEAQQQALYEHGIHLGLAFQIQDDLLDVYGDPKTFGKAIGGDICCNKKTYLLLTARDLANDAQRARMQELLAMPAGPDKIARMTALYDEIGVRQVAEEAIAEHTRAALRLLETMPQNEATESLRALANKLENRKS
jgi:geranylgeranyl diphosphate synthase type II